MFENFVLAADLHLTSREADSYRWDVFPQLIKLVKAEGCTDVILAGDICDFKDNHPAELVNMLAEALIDLAAHCEVHFLMGNHDLLKQDHPYFEFVKHFKGIRFYKEPFEDNGIYLLPFTKVPEVDWKELDFNDTGIAIMHQPVIGAQSSDHYQLEHGLSPTYFTDEHPEFEGQVFSGDIHVAQEVGDVDYIGAPYPIRFGDEHMNRVMWFTYSEEEGWCIGDVAIDTLYKWHITIDRPEDLEQWKDQVNTNQFTDMMKVKVRFSEDAYVNWQAWKKQIKQYITEELEVGFYGVTLETGTTESVEAGDDEDLPTLELSNPLEILVAYGDQEGIGKDLLDVGKTLIQSTHLIENHGA